MPEANAKARLSFMPPLHFHMCWEEGKQCLFRSQGPILHAGRHWICIAHGWVHDKQWQSERQLQQILSTESHMNMNINTCQPTCLYPHMSMTTCTCKPIQATNTWTWQITTSMHALYMVKPPGLDMTWWPKSQKMKVWNFKWTLQITTKHACSLQGKATRLGHDKVKGSCNKYWAQNLTWTWTLTHVNPHVSTHTCPWQHAHVNLYKQQTHEHDKSQLACMLSTW